MKRDLQCLFRTICRWGITTTLLSTLLFSAAGSTKIPSLRAYLIAYSLVLLITMLAVDPQLARERTHPGLDAGPFHLQFGPRILFLLTLTTAAFCVGRVPICIVSQSVRWLALATFILASFLQTWAMAANNFFSPSIYLQGERHRLIHSGPYQFIRHPGYLAMCVSVPASAVAIGSWLTLFPAAVFIAMIFHRARFEDQFLRANLPGYAEYARRVPSCLPFVRST